MQGKKQCQSNVPPWFSGFPWSGGKPSWKGSEQDILQRAGLIPVCARLAVKVGEEREKKQEKITTVSNDTGTFNWEPGEKGKGAAGNIRNPRV